MNDWTSGYVADIGYTFGYYQELNPLRSKFALLNAGLVPPTFGTHCELGFGQGVSINMHAAASGAEWYGTDFNPSQAAFAMDCAQASGANLHLFDQSFKDFCYRKDLPEFDSIGLHGIWSWISDENRTCIIDLINRKLKIGGVVYISYNTLPGWSMFAPLRHLMTEHAATYGVQGAGIINRIDGALEFADKLLELEPQYSRGIPQIADRIKRIKGQPRQYLAHEYFNLDWHPMYFSALANSLEQAKLQFACSAHFGDHVDVLNLSADQQKLLNEIADPLFRQTVRDYMVNQQFRRDYWIKGKRTDTTISRINQLRELEFVLMNKAEDVALKASGSLGEASLNKEVYEPIIETLSDNKPKSISELEKVLLPKGISLGQILQAMLILNSNGTLFPVQDRAIAEKARKHSHALNQHLMNFAKTSGELSYLASPLTGGGVSVSRFQQLFLLATMNKKNTPDECAAFAWEQLRVQGHRIVKNGSAIETDEGNLDELRQQANEFFDHRFKLLKNLMII